MQKKYNKSIIGVMAIFIALTTGANVLLAQKVPDMEPPSTPWVLRHIPDVIDNKTAQEPIAFKHGDVSWLPDLAIKVGWPKKTITRLKYIVLRESGGCPNRIGGSIVDKNCNIIGHTGATNKSDSGLLQINGVNWDPNRSGTQIACAQLKICTQDAILDPVNNLKVGLLLYEKAGWGPWDPCQWGPAYASRCKNSPKMPG